jgi:hypothetical protein
MKPGISSGSYRHTQLGLLGVSEGHYLFRVVPYYLCIGKNINNSDSVRRKYMLSYKILVHGNLLHGIM